MVIELRALDRRTQLDQVRAELHAERSEGLVFAGRVRYLGHKALYANRAEMPLVVEHCAGEIVSLADRRLRQLGGDAA